MATLDNPKHELFAQELAKGVSASEAYQRVGYKTDRGHASRLAANGNVQARVRELMAASAARCGVTVDRVVAELSKIGFGDIRKAVKWGSVAVSDGDGNQVISNGVALIDSGDLSDDDAAAIAEVSQTKEGLRVKFHDKRAALVDLGRYLGIFTDKVESRVTLTHEDALGDLA